MAASAPRNPAVTTLRKEASERGEALQAPVCPSLGSVTCLGPSREAAVPAESVWGALLPLPCRLGFAGARGRGARWPHAPPLLATPRERGTQLVPSTKPGQNAF